MTAKVVEFFLECEYCDKQSEPIALGIFNELFPFSEIDAIQQFETDWYDVMFEKMKNTIAPKAPERTARDRLIRHYTHIIMFIIEHSKHRIVLKNTAGDILVDGQWFKPA
jgi:hypothetical protein